MIINAAFLSIYLFIRLFGFTSNNVPVYLSDCDQTEQYHDLQVFMEQNEPLIKSMEQEIPGFLGTDIRMSQKCDKEGITMYYSTEKVKKQIKERIQGTPLETVKIYYTNI